MVVSVMRKMVAFIKAGSGWQSLGQGLLGTGLALVPFVGSFAPTHAYSLCSKQRELCIL